MSEAKIYSYTQKTDMLNSFGGGCSLKRMKEEKLNNREIMTITKIVNKNVIKENVECIITWDE